eukprot:CAMPEP_0202893170 /NCGR_PEP_ID=MMETSP1392-20130828/2803_1 /ASSEMBLY_ACC=CAM_ASM_000868 /TAXON_ID=225041 /ORGANISM="Chlamydomonas chlamydogama, Strain SAG 11-48b" /LENGTH=58 /DNA_ID=CAMNT_0049577405 /DNA_START=226 /DNA_END=399 /DNA_ORIENTATION=-
MALLLPLEPRQCVTDYQFWAAHGAALTHIPAYQIAVSRTARAALFMESTSIPTLRGLS